jgi:hypothetical protein
VTETETETVSGGIVVWKDRSWVWRRRDEERGDLDLSCVHIRRSHYRVVLIVDPVEGTERVRGDLTSHLGISVAHDRVPYFDGTTAFEYIYPYRAPIIKPRSNVSVFLEQGLRLTRQRSAHPPQRVQKERRDQCPYRIPSVSLSKSAAGEEIIVESTCARTEWLMTRVVPRTWLR